MVLTTLLMAGESARSRVLTLARRHRRLRMVVVTDADRVAAFLGEGCVVEHMPGSTQVARHAVRGDWDTYLRRRWQIILTKWEPALVREEGAALTDYLRACHVSETATVERSDGSSLPAPQGRPFAGRSFHPLGLRNAHAAADPGLPADRDTRPADASRRGGAC
ncbi:hypothetical protein KTN05_03480 [Paracoccus sp. Z118]|uniref:hypothetical protein n=1 Tax=Paracoccus sp. Z118 TaxID=2851017 RepID=UPI001C2C2082|nr:hypothetical protein [Paracoccus sp. Z118]MBV0890908.1 hypothetical protein [Paracoccus sp. Z118]